jgi:hypothetical protein
VIRLLFEVRLVHLPVDFSIVDKWPSTPSYGKLAVPEGRENHVLDVYLVESRPVELRLDGESVFPGWFKLEFKESGEVSAKVKGLRLATRFGDVINVHQGPPG